MNPWLCWCSTGIDCSSGHDGESGPVTEFPNHQTVQESLERLSNSKQKPQAELPFLLKSQPYVHSVVILMLALKTIQSIQLKNAPGLALRLWAYLISVLQGHTAKFIIIILQTD